MSANLSTSPLTDSTSQQGASEHTLLCTEVKQLREKERVKQKHENERVRWGEDLELISLEEFNEVLILAGEGSINATIEFAICMLMGWHCKKNTYAAAQIFKKHANQSIAAQFYLARNIDVDWHFDGSFFNTQSIQCFKQIKEAAKQDAEAMFYLALCYGANSRCIPQTEYTDHYNEQAKTTYRQQQAFQLYKTAALHGIAYAQDNLAIFYANNMGIPTHEFTDFKDDAEQQTLYRQQQAFHWWNEAAAQGLAQAQFQLADCYLNNRGITSGTNNPKTRWEKIKVLLTQAQEKLGLHDKKRAKYMLKSMVNTPMHYAIEGRRLDFLQMLIEDGGGEVYKTNDHYLFPEQLILELNPPDPAMVQLIASRHAIEVCLLNLESKLKSLFIKIEVNYLKEITSSTPINKPIEVDVKRFCEISTVESTTFANRLFQKHLHKIEASLKKKGMEHPESVLEIKTCLETALQLLVTIITNKASKWTEQYRNNLQSHMQEMFLAQSICKIRIALCNGVVRSNIENLAKPGPESETARAFLRQFRLPLPVGSSAGDSRSLSFASLMSFI